MKHFLKRFKGVIILVLIEAFFFFRIEKVNNEMFFFIWSIIALVLLLNNIFDINGDKSVMGIGANSRMVHASIISSFPWRKENNNKKSSGELYYSMNLLYLLFLIANIIGYIISYLLIKAN